ncbi:response regulator [Paenibacillus faecis]|uniref:Response regulator n=1 Tax=Paenibacillus faecis TaxID=862114 RepID=A0A5D0CYV3_9BACL|nr:response regulator [Paenibacillus faecis]TYA15211.1 response regulator [Paenibacillus faecis]
MYKVLLADDELLDLEGMKRFIPWSDLGLQVVGAVNNGFAACEVMEREPVDILVTDVNMPNMSGLELARIAIEKKPEVRVIFVSGYQDFNYVKQALSLKACSYVLKPMEDDELISSLRRITEELAEEERRKAAEKQYLHLKPMAKNDFLVRLLEGELALAKAEEFGELAASFGMDRLSAPLQAAVLEIDDLKWLQPGNAEAALHHLEMSLTQINEVLLGYGFTHSCKLSRQRIGILLHGERLRACVDELCGAVDAKASLSLTIGLGQQVPDLSRIHESYRQALEALEGKMFFGRGQVIKYEDVQQAPELSDARTLDLRLDALFKAMANYDLVLIHDEIENLFKSVSSLRSKFTIYNLAMYIVFKLDHYLHALDEDLFEMLGMELHSLDVVLQFEMVGDIRSWLVRKVFEISEIMRIKANSKNSRLIREILKTMRERMQENLTLKDIAEQFSFSPNYLGHLFKEEVGKSFSETLIGMRMERARELLKNPSLKIYEVADQVGYRYIPYFSRQFKETFGMTPMECRKRE